MIPSEPEGGRREVRRYSPSNGNGVGLIHEISIWAYVRKNFHEIYVRGDKEKFLEYLKTLRRILNDPFPEEGDVEKYVPNGLGIKSRYRGTLSFIGEIPETEASRKIHLKLAGGREYKAYREKAEEVGIQVELLLQRLRTRSGL